MQRLISVRIWSIIVWYEIKLCNQLLFSNQIAKCCSANHRYCHTRDMMKHDLWLAELQFCNWLLNSNWLQSFMLHPLTAPSPFFTHINFGMGIWYAHAKIGQCSMDNLPFSLHSVPQLIIAPGVVLMWGPFTLNLSRRSPHRPESG